jgi:hypothetical protein
VQTLILSRFVASRNNANHDSCHAFVDCYQKSSDFQKFSIGFTKQVPPEQKTDPHSSASF